MSRNRYHKICGMSEDTWNETVLQVPYLAISKLIDYLCQNINVFRWLKQVMQISLFKYLHETAQDVQKT